MEEDKLRSLFVVCKLPECRSAIDPDEVTFRYSGAAVHVIATCNSNHTEHWESSSSVGEGHGKHYVINVLLVGNGLLSEFQGLKCYYFFRQLSFSFVDLVYHRWLYML